VGSGVRDSGVDTPVTDFPRNGHQAADGGNLQGVRQALRLLHSQRQEAAVQVTSFDWELFLSY